MRVISRAAALALSLGLLAAVSAGPALAADEAVTITGFAFSPPSVTVNEGDTVTWTNEDGMAHTATGDGGAFDTGTLADGASATVTFDTAGTFAYLCSIHPTMTGTVVVETAAAAPSTVAPALTPAPTDTAQTEAVADAGSVIAPLLALFGVAMLVVTAATSRRRASD